MPLRAPGASYYFIELNVFGLSLVDALNQNFLTINLAFKASAIWHGFDRFFACDATFNGGGFFIDDERTNHCE